jgi:hypothetical protein
MHPYPLAFSFDSITPPALPVALDCGQNGAVYVASGHGAGRARLRVSTGVSRCFPESGGAVRFLRAFFAGYSLPSLPRTLPFEFAVPQTARTLATNSLSTSQCCAILEAGHCST